MWVYLRLLAAAVCIVAPAPASAWTDAHVIEANIDVTPVPDGRTHVAVELLLMVEGGWVEALELPGWDAVVGLDTAEPASLVTGDGRTLLPTAALNGRGGISMQFTRRTAPRKGEHRVRFGYLAESALSAHADGLRAGFTVPGWEAGLRRAVVTLHAPSGTQPVLDPDVPVTPRTQPEADGVRVVFERVHVPRNTPWTVLADVPAASPPRADPVAGAEPQRDVLTGIALALFVLAVGHLARGARRRRALPEPDARPPLPRGVAELAVCVGACWWTVSLSAALLCWASASVALALMPAPRDTLRVPFGRLVSVPPRAIAHAQRALRNAAWGGPLPFDGTTVFGALALLLLLLVPAAFSGAYVRDGAAWGFGVLCAVPSFFAGTRFEQTQDLARQLVQLSELAHAFIAPGWALRFGWLEGVKGARAPRIVCTSALRMTGVWSVMLVPASIAGGAAVLRLELDEALADAIVSAWSAKVLRTARGIRGRRVLELASADPSAQLDGLVEVTAQRSRALARAFAERSVNARVEQATQAA